jgi:aminoglycoside phosphotransferase (APT) family kinase protein
VLRRFVRADWWQEEPDAPEREAISLRTVTAVAAPRLVAVDPTGEEAGEPAVLMTRLPGRIDWEPRDLDTYLRRLAEPLPAIHAIAPDPRLPPYDPYSLAFTEPPGWSRRPETWRRGIELHLGPQPERREVLIHRDYHPGNVLWRRGRVTGVVDWANTSRGVPEADVGHCRMNLAGRFGQATADRFLALYRALTGRDEYHPYWDVVAAIGGVDIEDVDRRTEEFLAAAVARL